MAETSAGSCGGSAAHAAGGSLALVAGLLGDAERSARTGEIQQAREICGDLILNDLPWFVADRALLVRLVGTLVATRSRGLLGSVLRATTGSAVRDLPPEVLAAPDAGGLLEVGERLVAWAHREAGASLALA